MPSGSFAGRRGCLGEDLGELAVLELGVEAAEDALGDVDGERG
jgi:hypothetical protein